MDEEKSKGGKSKKGERRSGSVAVVEQICVSFLRVEGGWLGIGPGLCVDTHCSWSS